MNPKLRASIRSALLGGTLAATVVSAAEPQQTSFIEEIEVVLVTGSYIAGAAEEAALPIDVLTAEDLAKQGSPSMVDLIKSIPSVQGVVGESNQFTAGQTTGSSTINLRGLGSVRTLVLLNGRRLAISPANIGYDANLLPIAAIGRIEVLKDGAAATYGSDAVAGVVNFITKTGFEGVSLDASYNYIDGSDGDYTANAVWGHKAESWDMLLAAGYRQRSELSTTDRDFATPTFEQNPQGGWSTFGSPGAYLTPGSAVAGFRDPGCAALGGVPATGTTCRFQYITFDNLVEKEEHYQAYGEFNKQFGESTGFHFEAMYAVHDVPEENSSPSYAPTQGPALGTGTNAGNITGPTYVIPLANPGLQALIPFLSAAEQAAVLARPSILASGLQWRPFGNGGNPFTGEGKQDERLYDAYRVSTGLNGEFGSTNWDVAATYMENRREANTPDIIASRLQAALSGFGGPNCTGTTAGANGCLWLNPFSTGFANNPSTGAVNNATFTPSTVNSQELGNWLYQDSGAVDTATTFVVDAVLNGQLPFGVGAGDIGWAAGLQYRDEGFERDPNKFSDIATYPCVDSLTGNTTCNVNSGLFTFFGPLLAQDLQRDITAEFAELSVPILDNLQAQVAVRHEDYGGTVGDTTNPKLSVRWQLLDSFALRGSVGTTFRGPLQSQLLNSPVTALAFTPAAGGYKPYDTFGSQNLKPEEAFTFNVGMILKAGGFSGTLDYWSYDFTDSLENESGTEMVAAFFGTVAPSATNPNPPNQCGNPIYAGLQSRFTFVNNVCGIGSLLRTRINTINGPDQKISGVDAALSYRFDDVLSGVLTLGTEATYTMEYKREAAIVEGIVIQQAGDFAGTRGSSGLGSSTLPELRGSVYFDYATQLQGLRLTTRYIDGVTDIRAGLATATSRGVEVDSFLTFDLVYRLSLPAQTTLSAAVFNIADEDPPFARLDLSYEPFIGNPLGRYFKLAVTKRFD
jgi:iron complex outermembrane receptor protein